MDNILVSTIVSATDRIINMVRNDAFVIEEAFLNIIEISSIRVGNLPLQGIKLFVTAEAIRDFLSAIILQPVTPTALHPSPIHMVRACLPLLPALLKGLLRL
jgi:hypothetical protein